MKMQQHHGLADLFIETLRDIYSAEKQILRSLPKLARAADSATLREAFLTHRDQTEDQIERLDQVFELVGARPGQKTCEAMQGILEEGDETMADYAGSEALDAGLIASSQAVEHYEISRYAALCDWAKALGIDRAATLLGETLEEEKETDRLLTEIAEGAANQEGGPQKQAKKASASGRATTAPGGQRAAGTAGKATTARSSATTPAKTGPASTAAARTEATTQPGRNRPAGEEPSAGPVPTPAASAGTAQSGGSQKSPVAPGGRPAGQEGSVATPRVPGNTSTR